MSKTDKLREALRAKNNRMPYADALKIVGVRANMQHMLAAGEIEVVDEDEGKFVILDPDFKIKQTLPIKRKSKRAKGSKKKHGKTRTERPFKALVEKHAGPKPVDQLLGLLYDNLISSAKALTETLRREVEGVESNPNLMAAIETQERAIQIAKAA